MGTSVIRQSQARGIKSFLGTGLHILNKDIPSSYSDNPCYCPFLLDESCEEAKDPDYKTRCASETFSYLNCRLYAILSKKQEQSPQRLRVSDPLRDTVIMSAEDIVNSGKLGHARGMKPHHTHRSDESLHDRVADGADPMKFFGLRKSLTTRDEVVEIPDQKYIEFV